MVVWNELVKSTRTNESLSKPIKLCILIKKHNAYHATFFFKTDIIPLFTCADLSVWFGIMNPLNMKRVVDASIIPIAL